jgi:hypothetical protein
MLRILYALFYSWGPEGDVGLRQRGLIGMICADADPVLDMDGKDAVGGYGEVYYRALKVAGPLLGYRSTGWAISIHMKLDQDFDIHPILCETGEVMYI